MTSHDVRPARRRDLAHLALDEVDGPGFVMVAGEPAAAHLSVSLAKGHALLAAPGGDPLLHAALVEAACERLAARGHGQALAALVPSEAPSYGGRGFTEVPPDEPVPGHLADLHADEGTVLMRRVLRAHRTLAELEGVLPTIDASPRDVGVLRAVVRRPAAGEREVLDVGRLDVVHGLVGDTWASRGSRRTPDGSAHPDMQLNLMNHRLVEFLAQDPQREQLAGDQMFVDLDLSHENLPVWSELHIGGPDGAVIVVTDQPHNGCGKFIARFGKDALTFVNGPEGTPRRLRGLCARVVRPGPVRPGDEVVVRRPDAGAGA
ncbi:hypothetical protein F4692_002874 [Nocardioides cavernae]|uniref:MOSC domain-containing protein n=1 Tax=Nocardioides cavernae TaxID=1921566 RepID=A0A7Y9H4X0_9ACTN|nr:hypothetical protein [Nocardioides cavernae]NYE37741.1 hypothetical protein [Nocardioides cavernae]